MDDLARLLVLRRRLGQAQIYNGRVLLWTQNLWSRWLEKQEPRRKNQEEIIKKKEKRTDQEPRTKNQEPRTKNQEPRTTTKNHEPGDKNQDPRTENKMKNKNLLFTSDFGFRCSVSNRVDLSDPLDIYFLFVVYFIRVNLRGASFGDRLNGV